MGNETSKKQSTKSSARTPMDTIYEITYAIRQVNHVIKQVER